MTIFSEPVPGADEAGEPEPPQCRLCAVTTVPAVSERKNYRCWRCPTCGHAVYRISDTLRVWGDRPATPSAIMAR